MTGLKAVSSRLAIVLTVAAVFFWGSNFEAGKLALASLPPLTAAAERFALAALGMLVVLALSGGVRLDVLARNARAYVGLGLLGVAAFNGGLFWGLQTSNPVTAALIMATTPLTANLMEAALEHRAPARARIAGACISFCGVALMVVASAAPRGGLIGFAPGDPVIFAASLGWAAYTVGCRAFVDDASPLETTTWTMAVGALALSGAAFAVERPAAALAQATALSEGAVLYMAVAGSMLGYLFWTIGVATRGAGPTSALFNLAPVCALTIAVALGQRISLVQLCGAALTLCGVALGEGALSAASPLRKRASLAAPRDP